MQATLRNHRAEHRADPKPSWPDPDYKGNRKPKSAGSVSVNFGFIYSSQFGRFPNRPEPSWPDAENTKT